MSATSCKPIAIAHRGNLFGPDPERENSPALVLEALEQGYLVEVDCWLSEGQLFLGHDEPRYPVNLEMLRDHRVIVHAKDGKTLLHLLGDGDVEVFWHDRDDYTLTSKGLVWCYPGKEVPGGVWVLPERTAGVPRREGGTWSWPGVTGVCGAYPAVCTDYAAAMQQQQQPSCLWSYCSPVAGRMFQYSCGSKQVLPYTTNGDPCPSCGRPVLFCTGGLWRR